MASAGGVPPLPWVDRALVRSRLGEESSNSSPRLDPEGDGAPVGPKEAVRREQNRRYRARRKEREKKEHPHSAAACEGHRKRRPCEFFSCDRPGCYELFWA